MKENKQVENINFEAESKTDFARFYFLLLTSTSAFITPFLSRFIFQEKMNDFFGSSENRAAFEHLSEAFAFALYAIICAHVAKNKLSVISSDEKKWQNFIFCVYIPLYILFQTWWESMQSETYNRDFQWDQYLATWIGVLIPVLLTKFFQRNK